MPPSCTQALACFEGRACTHARRPLTRIHTTNTRSRLSLCDLQLASNARRLYGLNLCRGLGDKFLKDEDLGECRGDAAC